jgi:hypothetical protein
VSGNEKPYLKVGPISIVLGKCSFEKLGRGGSRRGRRQHTPPIHAPPTTTTASERNIHQRCIQSPQSKSGKLFRTSSPKEAYHRRSPPPQFFFGRHGPSLAPSHINESRRRKRECVGKFRLASITSPLLHTASEPQRQVVGLVMAWNRGVASATVS